MIAAVPSETLAALMGQTQTANGATPAGGGFNVLLDMLMAVEPQAAKAAQGERLQGQSAQGQTLPSSFAGAELIEMASEFSGDETMGQGNSEPRTGVEQASAIVTPDTEISTWMQLQQPCAPVQTPSKTQTVATPPATDPMIKNSVTVPGSETKVFESILPAAEHVAAVASDPIAAIVEKFAGTTATAATEDDTVEKTQTEPKAALQPASQTTTIEPAVLNSAKTPAQTVEPKQKQENAPAAELSVNTMAAAIVTITPAPEQIATKPTADAEIPSEPIKNENKNGKTQIAAVVNTATVIELEAEPAQAAPVIEMIKKVVQRETSAGTPSKAAPAVALETESKGEVPDKSAETVAQVANVNAAATQTVPSEAEQVSVTPGNARQAKTAAPTGTAKTGTAKTATVTTTAANTTAQVSNSADQEIGVPGATTKTGYTWNLSELIHRFDQQLSEAMGETEPAVTTPAAAKVSSGTPTAATPQTTSQAEPIATPAKTTTVEPETKTLQSDSVAAIAPQQTAATWEAKPAEVTDSARSAHLAEQVRQASEWLAEKAEGTIRVGDHGTEANMKLYPPDMGGLRVKLSVTNDLTVQAQFIADRPEAALAIKQNINQLQQAFVRQGMTLDSVQVSVAPAASSSNGNGSAGQQQNFQQQNFSSERREPETMSQQQNRQFENRNQQERRQRQQA